VASVCTGAFLLHEAGPARGRRVATHHAFQDALAARGEITVVRDARYVVDGNLITSQGVSAGIDMALWLVGHVHGRHHARAVRRYIHYDPAPPYLADEPSLWGLSCGSGDGVAEPIRMDATLCFGPIGVFRARTLDFVPQS
jgi:transcriptional regulator GlxA family with amidase domain